MEEPQKNQGLLELSYSSVSENGTEVDPGTDLYEVRILRRGTVRSFSWSAEGADLTLEFHPERVLVRRQSPESSYRMELILGKETRMDLETPYGAIPLRVKASELAYRETEDFPAGGGAEFRLVYEMPDGDASRAGRVLSGKIRIKPRT